jgi:hypothetical protein
MPTMTVTAVTRGGTNGEVLADGWFWVGEVTNLVIHCGKEIAALAATLRIENPDTPVMIDFEIPDKPMRVYLHECDLDSGCCDICGKWARYM